MTRKRDDLDELLFPNDESDTFELNLRWHMARVQAAIRFIDEMKMDRFAEPATAETIARIDKRFSRAVERVLELNR